MTMEYYANVIAGWYYFRRSPGLGLAIRGLVMAWQRLLGSLAHVLFAVACAVGTASAQNAARGQTLYASFPYGCSDCHATNPKNDPKKNKPSGGVKSGTTWQNILLGINGPVGGSNEMTNLLKPFYDGGQI